MSIESLEQVLEKIKSDRRIKEYDESTTKQKIVLQILSLLNWDIFSDEVTPEFSVESRRVDYALKLTSRNFVFLEVKNPREDLETHENQLLDYAFRQGVEIAILTNGITWWFYLPTKPGEWSSRKFYTIDIFEQETNSCSDRFIEFLEKERVLNGDAVKSAEKIYKSQVKKNSIEQTLPEAWNKIISEQDSLLIDLMIESTEKLCGYRPDNEDVVNFLKKKQEQLILDTEDDLIAQERISTRRRSQSYKHDNEAQTNFEMSEHWRSTGLIKISFESVNYEVSTIPQLYKIVLKRAVDSGDISKIKVPWGLGTKRYFLCKGADPRHVNGRDFFKPVSYKGYHFEAHVNRNSGIKYIIEFCEEIGYKLKILEM